MSNLLKAIILIELWALKTGNTSDHDYREGTQKISAFLVVGPQKGEEVVKQPEPLSKITLFSSK